MNNLEYSNYEMGNDPEISEEFNFEDETTSFELIPELDEVTYEDEFNYEISSYEVTPVESELIFEFGTINTEDELGQFVKSIAKKAAGAASSFLNSPTGQNLTNKLTNIAKKTIPDAIKSAGTKVGGYAGSQLGSAIDKRLGSSAGLGKDILGYAGQKLGAYGGQQAGQAVGNKVLSFIRFAKDAVHNAANSNPAAPTTVKTNTAIVKAAKKHYPVILKKKCRCSSNRRPGATRHNEVPYDSEFSYEDEFSYEGESEYLNEYSFEGEYDGEITSEGIFNEMVETELATELLSITNEQELDMFLGKLIKSAAGAVKTFAKSPAGKALGGALKQVAKKALPIAGKALGNMVLPGVGGMIGGKLATMATKLFEIESEGMSMEDMELAVAKRYVRFAGNAARRASRSGRGLSPSAVVRKAITGASRVYAPGLLRQNWSNNYVNNYQSDPYSPYSGQAGQWFRQGNSVILQGI